MVRITEVKLYPTCNKQVWAPLQLKGSGTFIVTNFCALVEGDCYSLKRNKIRETYPIKFIRESKPSPEEAELMINEYKKFLEVQKSFDGSTTCLKL